MPDSDDAGIAGSAGHGAGPDAPDREGPSPLELAAQDGMAYAARALLKERADPDAVDPGGWTALHFDVAGADPGTLVPVLLDGGAGVNIRDANGWMPLHWAAALGLGVDAVAALLGAGARPDAHTGWGWTPLHYAAMGGDPLLVPGAAGNGGRSAERDGDPKVIEALARAGAGLDDRDSDGHAPLHLAAMAGAERAAAALIACGSGTAARDRNGQTAMHMAAATNRDTRVIDLLLKAGADRRLRDRFGRAPIHITAEAGESITVTCALADTEGMRTCVTAQAQRRCTWRRETAPTRESLTSCSHRAPIRRSGTGRGSFRSNWWKGWPKCGRAMPTGNSTTPAMPEGARSDPENDPLRREIGLVREELRRMRAAGDAAAAEQLEAELLDLIEQLNGWPRS